MNVFCIYGYKSVILTLCFSINYGQNRPMIHKLGL